MTGDLLLRLLTRSGAGVVAPLALALEVPTLLESRAALGHTWASTIEVANGSAVLLVILGAVASCTLALRWVRHAAMLDGFPGRSAGYWWAPALLTSAVLVAVHGLWVLGVCVLTAGGTTGHVSWWPLLPVPFAVLAGCLLGGGVAVVTRSWLAPVLLGVLLYVGLVTTSSGSLTHLLGLGGVGHAIEGMRVRPEVPAVQLAWFGLLAAVSATGTLLLVRRSAKLIVTVGLAAVAMVVAAGAAVAVGPQRYELDPELSWSCSGQAPRVCRPDGSSLDPSLVARVQEADARWAAVLGQDTLAATYWERLGLPVPGHDTEVALSGSMSDQHLLESVIAAGYPCSDGWTYGQYEAMHRVATVLAGSPLEETAPGLAASVAQAGVRGLASLDCRVSR